jgi:HAD superfamily hydrolase (TIGR01509 family)
MSIEVVFLDIGGVLYDDRIYRDALQASLRELGATMSDAEYTDAYEACRRRQDGSFKQYLAARFLGPAADVGAVERVASRHWRYPAHALEPDVRSCLEVLRQAGYRIGAIANQPSAVRAALDRDGILGHFSVWVISEDLGLQKPDPRIYAHAVEEAGAEPAACAMVGDRLDYDIRPARSVGMRTVWVLRGEAPDDPSPGQIAEADVTIRGLDELRGVLARWSRGSD